MTIPIHIPPNEIIDALEVELDAAFKHFIVSKKGVVEGLFNSNQDSDDILIVSFEAKRELLNIEGELDMALGEMDNDALEALRTMLETMIDDVESKLSIKTENIFEVNTKGESTPEFDDWFKP